MHLRYHSCQPRIEEGDEVSPWVSHVSWHMMMFSFPLIRQRPCMHSCLAPVPHLLLYLTSFEIFAVKDAATVWR